MIRHFHNDLPCSLRIGLEEATNAAAATKWDSRGGHLVHTVQSLGVGDGGEGRSLVETVFALRHTHGHRGRHIQHRTCEQIFPVQRDIQAAVRIQVYLSYMNTFLVSELKS